MKDLTPFLAFACLLLLSLNPPCFAADNQDQVHREMVATLEAYAVYKMGRYAEAFVAWQALADRANVQGLLNVGHAYLNGQGVAQDTAKAMDWYQQAAKQGDANAFYALAQLYEQGVGVDKNLAQAQTYYRQAAEAGLMEAQLYLARSLPDEAKHWLQRAADQGNHEALLLLNTAEPNTTAQSQLLNAKQRQALVKALQNMDYAANTRDAESLVAAIQAEAMIRVQLPTAKTTQTLSLAGYQQLWQSTFQQSERYRFNRLQYQIAATDQGADVHSQIREYFTDTTPRSSQQLVLDERLTWVWVNGKWRIDAVDLRIERVIEK